MAEYSDDGVKGADPVDQRPGFAEMMKHIAGNGVRTIMVETANRFARDLIVQETGWRFLKDAGINLIAADSPSSFLDDTPTARLIRQVLGAGNLPSRLTILSSKSRCLSWHRCAKRSPIISRTTSQAGNRSGGALVTGHYKVHRRDLRRLQ